MPLRLFILPLIFLLTTGAFDTLRFTVDGPQSAVSAKVAFLGIASKTAQFPKVSGSAVVVPQQPDALHLDVTLDARALTAPDSVTLKRLKGEKFFWVEKYPTVHFIGDGMRFTSPTSGTIEGMLTARGVTKPVTLEVTFDRPPATLAPGEPVTLTGSTRIDRRQFGMTAYSLIVGRKVDITIKARMVPG
ncbi:YceI family protein [Erythrobacter mangrovi]|uniref:YceI family protein n=1 Tax=Erythrobacter mangrovi TaxID=2739433 RepID=A0A7D3XXM2_9SPHN|nr:YceI family protein [Erythrobacter mangrovi]QKG72536.1 YceI family protein [Erythrobacter mangrovi]